MPPPSMSSRTRTKMPRPLASSGSRCKRSAARNICVSDSPETLESPAEMVPCPEPGLRAESIMVTSPASTASSRSSTASSNSVSVTSNAPSQRYGMSEATRSSVRRERSPIDQSSSSYSVISSSVASFNCKRRESRCVEFPSCVPTPNFCSSTSSISSAASSSSLGTTTSSPTHACGISASANISATDARWSMLQPDRS